MKTLTFSLALMLMMISVPNSSSAQQATPLSEQQQELIETNVLANLDHNSIEVRANTIQLLIDLKKTYPNYDFTYSIIPMMETLKSDDKAEFRILAALALYHLDSELGRYAVKQRVTYDDSDRVTRHCANLIRNWDKKRTSTDLMAELASI